jgi:alkanesulfonate monooxygenase SsuD/methylene tetrahydromethanopterin reductase-like flavin-dependent oxidoreductase (luciferase family)
LAGAGRALAGTPETVREQLLHQIEVSGINFVLTRFAFGNLPFEHSKRSVSLFASDVMPWILERTDALQPH